MRNWIPCMQEWGPCHRYPGERGARRNMGDAMDMDEEIGNLTSSTDAPRSAARKPPAATPAPVSPTLSEQPPSPRRYPVRHPELESFDRECERPQAPGVDRAQYDQMKRGANFMNSAFREVSAERTLRKSRSHDWPQWTARKCRENRRGAWRRTPRIMWMGNASGRPRGG